MRSGPLRDGPERIVCLTEETTETLYLLGEPQRIVGVSAYTVRPPEARADKPAVSGFKAGNIRKICALEPDLVVGFSDIQADLARALIQANVTVLITNQRTLREILETILLVGRIVGQTERAANLVRGYVARLEAARARAAERARPVRVYFEEWDDPLICGITWVSELIEAVGGIDVFADRATAKGARERIVSSKEVVARAPEVMLASWCGKKFDREAVFARPGWSATPALRDGRVHDVDPAIILQPGPACLTDGLDTLERLITSDPPPRSSESGSSAL